MIVGDKAIGIDETLRAGPNKSLYRSCLNTLDLVREKRKTIIYKLGRGPLDTDSATALILDLSFENVWKLLCLKGLNVETWKLFTHSLLNSSAWVWTRRTLLLVAPACHQYMHQPAGIQPWFYGTDNSMSDVKAPNTWRAMSKTRYFEEDIPYVAQAGGHHAVARVWSSFSYELWVP